ncbi:flippase [Romboutsia sp. 1001713B170207_170306_H8]|uniref:flippase n=1 Tax=Romboutsia sp. 1001713B170207_170306_H8 TaxID=2787112 RepID=UPI000822E5AF|nr:flippase [Romboutsia sp. 1001713B170207_170306_H8]SCI44904.1 Putative O-antigen transporter [uncultured Clostridium sp.]
MSSIKKNFIYNCIYQILILILPLATTPYISRVLGVENIGIYSYTQSIAYYFMIFAMLGVNNYGNRSCARVRENRAELSKTFYEIYSLQFIMSLMCIVLYSIYAIFLAKINRVIFYIQILYVFSVIFDINWFFFSLEKFKITIVRNVFIKVFTIILIFVFIKNESQLKLYTAIMAVGTLLSQLVIWPFLKRYIDLNIPRANDIFKHLKPNLILFVPVVAVSIYKYMDKIMIGSMTGMIQEGYYVQAEKVLNIPLGLISALGTVMLPRMSNLAYRNKNEESKILINKSMLFISFLSPALAFGLAGISQTFIPLFLGDSFIDCIDILTSLSFSVLFVGWANIIRTQYLMPNNKDKVYLFTVCFGAIVNLIGNLILIPNFGAIGAVIATILSEATVAISQTIMVRNELPIISYLKGIIPFFILGFIMFFIIRSIGIFSNLFISLLVQLFIGSSVYIIGSIIIMVVYHRKEFNEFISFTRRYSK